MPRDKEKTMTLYLASRVFKAGLTLLVCAGSLYAQPWNLQNEGGNPCEPICAPSYESCDDWLSLNRFALGADFLWWKATEDNLAFAYKTQSVSSDTADFFHGRSQSLHSKFKPGVRVYLDYTLPCNSWDAGFTWTHLVNNSSDTATSAGTTEDGLLPGLGLSGALGHTITRAKARWHMSFNDYVWDLGQRIDVTSCFAVRPYFGLKYLQIRQSFRNKAVGTLGIEAAQEGGCISTRYQAFGFQGGIGAEWGVGCGFSIYSDLGGGIVYGRAHTAQGILSTTETKTTLSRYKDSQRVARPNVDFAIGLAWTAPIWNCYLVNIRAGWEYHHYFNQNFFRDGVYGNGAFVGQTNGGSKRYGDLSMHGLTVGANIQF